MDKAEFKKFTDKKKIKTTTVTNVECSSDIACEVKDIISIKAFVTALPAECIQNGVNFGGKVIFNVIYMLEGEIKRKEIGVEFSDKTELNGVGVEDKVNVEFCVDGLTCQKEGALKFYAVIKTYVYATMREEEDYLASGEGYVCKEDSREITTQIGRLKETYTLDDKFETCVLKDVLASSADAIVTSCQCGVGSVIVDGEIILSLSLLPLDEKSDIFKENRIIPFRLELECSSCSVSDFANAKAVVDSTKIKVVVDEAKNKSTVVSEIGLSLYGEAYKKESFSFIDDLFSTERVLSIAKERVEKTNFSGCKYLKDKVLSKAFCDVPEGCRLITDTAERVYAVGLKYEGGKIIVDGVLACYVMFKEYESGKLIGRSCEMPFMVSFEEEGEVDDLACVLRSITPTLRNGEVELEAEVAIFYSTVSKEDFSVITSLEEKEEIEKDDSAFCLYVPGEKEQLWDVCKALKVTPELITEQNPDLVFPASGQKILIYKRA